MGLAVADVSTASQGYTTNTPPKIPASAQQPGGSSQLSFPQSNFSSIYSSPGSPTSYTPGPGGNYYPSAGTSSQIGPGGMYYQGSTYGPGGLYQQNQPTPTGAIPGNPQVDPLAMYKSIYGQYMSNAAPVFANLDQQEQFYQNQQGQLEGAYGQRSGAAAQGAALQNQGIDLEMEKLGINRDALSRQPGYLDAQLKNLEDRRQADQGHLANLMGINDTQLAAQLGGAKLDADRQTRQERSDATAAGAITASGTGLKLSDIQSNYGFTAKNFQAQHDYQQEGIKRRWDDSFFEEQAAKASTAEQKNAIMDQQKTLDVTAKQYGLQREQIANSLAQTLASMNLDKITSVGAILQNLNSTDEKKAQLSYSILSQALQTTGALGGFAGTPTGQPGG